MFSCLGLWFHSDIELLLFQGLYFINKNTTHRMEQQVTIVWELLYLNYSCSHIFFLESSYSQSIIRFRGMSSAHAIFITAVSLYLVASTDLFSDRIKGRIIFHNSIISTSALGVTEYHFIFSWHSCVLNVCFTGFCRLLHHRSCNDLLAVPFPWWNGVCKWIYLIANIFFSSMSLLYFYSMCK